MKIVINPLFSSFTQNFNLNIHRQLDANGGITEFLNITNIDCLKMGKRGADVSARDIIVIYFGDHFGFFVVE